MAGSDYVGVPNGLITFAAGETSKTVWVQIINDSEVESPEPFKVLITSAVGADVGVAQQSISILSEDQPAIVLKVNSIFATGDIDEGDSATFNVGLNIPVGAAAGAAVPLLLRLGNAGASLGALVSAPAKVSYDGGGSWTSLSTDSFGDLNLVVPQGVQSFLVSVPTSYDEQNVNRVLNLSTADLSVDGSATVRDKGLASDLLPKINIVADATSVAEGPGKKIGYTVTLSAAATGTVTVDYSASDISATAGSDYTLTRQSDNSTTLSFAPGETSKRIEVQILDDSTYEGPETFKVQLSNLVGQAKLGSTTSVMTRIDDDDPAPPPTFQVVPDVLSSKLEDSTPVFSIADLLANDTYGGVKGSDPAAGLVITNFTPGKGLQSIDRVGDNFELHFIPNFNGTAAFSYTVRSSDGREVVGQATLEVTPVADDPVQTKQLNTQAVYGWAPRIQQEQIGFGVERQVLYDAYLDQGLVQYSPYQTVGGPSVYDYGDGPVAGSDVHDYGIPLAYFQSELARQTAGMDVLPQFIRIGINGAQVWVPTSVSLYDHNSVVSTEQSNDGKLLIQDVDDPLHQDSYVFTSLKSTDETYGGKVESFSGNSFVFTGMRYVEQDANGNPVGQNVLTDQHGRNEEVRQVTLTGTMQNSQGKVIPVTFQVPAFGPAPKPNIASGGKKPIAIDLNGDGFHFKDIDDSNVFFDVNGDGWRRKIAWNNPQDGFIVLDENGDGKITDYDELSFIPHKPDGQSDLDALKAFDTNGDGVFSAADRDWKKFGVWRDANSNGVTDPGELMTLDSLGINRIELSSDGKLEVINGQSVTGKGKAIKNDGTSYAIADVTLKYRDVTVVTPPDGSPTYVAPVPKYQPGQTLDGTTGNDLILGASGSDVFRSGDGNDVIHDDGGNDYVQAGAGDDVVFTGMDNDVVEAGPGNDQVFAGVGDDLVFGEEGDDFIMLEGGNDIAFGGAGNDMISGGAGNDAISGDDGDDKLFGEDGWDALFGQDGNDELRGMDGNDYLDGGAGNDLLSGGAGDDKMDGGTGDDIYEVDSAGDQVIEAANAGNDTVMASISYDLKQAPNVENITLTGTADLNATGDDGANRLLGNAGKNLLIGGGGNDVLDGGQGADTLKGGTGDDTYYVDDKLDVVTELAGEGVDLVISRVDYIAPDNVENVTLAGIGAATATGNALDNVLTGNAQDNVIDGLAGADTMIGGQGNDRYIVDNAGDVVRELAGEGYDTIAVSGVQSYALPDNVEALELANGVIQASGNALDNFIRGSDDDNVLRGLAGNDALSGGRGNDILEGGDGNDLLDGGDGNDILDGGTGADVMRGGAGDDQYVVDSANDVVIEVAQGGNDSVTVSGVTEYVLPDFVEGVKLGVGVHKITGNTDANSIQSSTEANEILGLGGNDVIVDAGGDDVIDGGDGNDSITDQGAGTNILRGGAGNDTITVDGVSSNTIDGGTGDDVIRVNLATGQVAFRSVNVIAAGAGNDTILTAAGSDTLSFGFGDGADVWADDATAGGPASPSDGVVGSDTLLLGDGVKLENLQVARVGNDLLIKLARSTSLTSSTGDQLLLKGWFTAVDNRIETIRFADGTALDADQFEKLLTAIRGTDGPDTLVGTAASDLILGLGGNDQILGAAGDDLLFGGDGDDTFVLQAGDTNGLDQYDGGSGVNKIVGSSSGDTLHVTSNLSNLKNIQVIDGGDTNWWQNTIVATSGDDTLDFSAMTLTNFGINAGAGNDTVTGSQGNDFIIGGAGDDVLNGGAGDDTFVLQAGDTNGLDQYDGGSGVNKIVGSSGGDTLHVTSNLSNLKNIQVIEGGDYNWWQNTIVATSGDDTLDFSAMTLTNFGINAGAGNDTVTGTQGNDFITGGAGDDVLNGGAGNDTYLYSRGDGYDTISDVTGFDCIDFGSSIPISDISLSSTSSSLVFSIKTNGVESGRISAAFGTGGTSSISSVKIGSQWYAVTQQRQGPTLSPVNGPVTSSFDGPTVKSAAQLMGSSDAVVAPLPVLHRWAVVGERLDAMSANSSTPVFIDMAQNQNDWTGLSLSLVSASRPHQTSASSL
jgi:Ca2+-binding RTX toxin-like protein